MPKGILALPGVPRGIDEARMVAALALANPDPQHSFQSAVERLPQAWYLRVTPDSFESKPYWSPFDAKPIRFARNSDYEEALLEVFDRAVDARLRSITPISTQLSAGMDSSSVTASAARLLAARGQSLTAYTAVPRPGFLGKGFHGRIPDEGPGAAEVAALYPNLKHVCIDSSGIPLLSTLHEICDALDEPPQNGINLLWITAIHDAAIAAGSRVLLVGARGNATLSFTGLEALTVKFRRGRWLDLLGTTYRMRRGGYISWRNAFTQATFGLFPDPIYRWLRRSGEFSVSYSPASKDALANHRIYERMLAEFYDNSGDINLERAIFFERFDDGSYNAASRALHRLDVRDPCSDKRLFDFCYAIPLDQFIVGDQPRSLVRRAMRGRLPASTLARTIRGQQGADWYLTMQEARPTFAAAAAEVESSPSAQRLLDLPRMRHLLETWPDSGLEEMENSLSYGDALCRFMTFGYFLAREDAAIAAQALNSQ